MICFIRKRGKFCKKILLDIWGHNEIYLKKTRLMQFQKSMEEHENSRKKYYRKEFSFTLDKKLNFRNRERYKKKYLQPRLLFNYFLLIRRRMFLRYAYKAKRQSGYFIKNYLTLIEGRLFMLIYRSNFVSNIFKLKYIIDRGIFYVNTVKRYYSNYNVKVGDLIQVDFNFKKLLKQDFLIRLKYYSFINSIQYDYMYVNYNFMCIFFLRAPKLNDIEYPIDLDIYLGSSVYFL